MTVNDLNQSTNQTIKQTNNQVFLGWILYLNMLDNEILL